MKKEDWDLITNKWGDSDELTMEEIAKIKDRDEVERTGMLADIEERNKKIQELTQQNIDLNKTNMSLILRLTDPSIQPPEPDKEPTKPPRIDEYEKFVTFTID